MSKLQEALDQYEIIRTETVINRNTALRVGAAGKKLCDALSEELSAFTGASVDSLDDLYKNGWYEPIGDTLKTSIDSDYSVGVVQVSGIFGETIVFQNAFVVRNSGTIVIKTRRLTDSGSPVVWSAWEEFGSENVKLTGMTEQTIAGIIRSKNFFGDSVDFTALQALITEGIYRYSITDDSVVSLLGDIEGTLLVTKHKAEVGGFFYYSQVLEATNGKTIRRNNQLGSWSSWIAGISTEDLNTVFGDSHAQHSDDETYETIVNKLGFTPEQAGIAQGLIDNLKNGVVTEGDTLYKLYTLIISGYSEVTVANTAARDAYDITKLPTTIFVVDDGDSKWALYKATTIGVGATFIKLSDPDLLNAVMTGSQIAASYEGYSDVVRFSSSLKSTYDALVSNATHTGDVTGSTVLTIAPKAVTLAKMADMAAQSFLGNKETSSGTPEVLSIADTKSLLGINIIPTGTTITTEITLDQQTTIGTYAVSLPAGGADVTALGGSRVFSLEVVENVISATPSSISPRIVTQVAFVTDGTNPGTYTRTVRYDGANYTNTGFVFASGNTSNLIHTTGKETKSGELLTKNYGSFISDKASLDSIILASSADLYNLSPHINVAQITVAGNVLASDNLMTTFGGSIYGGNSLSSIITVYTDFVGDGVNVLNYVRQRAFSALKNGWYYRKTVANNTSWTDWKKESNTSLDSNRTTGNFVGTIANGGTATADFTSYDICKYNYPTGPSTSIVATFDMSFSPLADCCKVVTITNSSSVTLTVILPTSLGGIFTLLSMQSAVVSVPPVKTVEISYLFRHSTATSCIVSVIYSIQA